jgi:hypothetical protein
LVVGLGQMGGERKEREGVGEPVVALCQAAPPFTVVSHRRSRALHPPPPLCVQQTRGGEGEMDWGYRGHRPQAVLFGRGARSSVHRDGRPAATGGSWAGCGPAGGGRQVETTACSSVAWPRAHAYERRPPWVGLHICAKDTVNEQYTLRFIMNFRSLFDEFLYSFDDFHLDFISTQIEPTRYLCRD